MGDLTRFGIEEYVSDCVVTLDHRVTDEISTRRLRVVKYRGSLHGTNEYPFLITAQGLVVVPITSVGLTYEASMERVSTGVQRLDEMLFGGVYRGSSVMISGTAGTGKTSIGAMMANASCERGEKALFFSFEESPEQLVRNMRSINIDLQRWIDEGLLQVRAVRPTAFGFEESDYRNRAQGDADRAGQKLADRFAHGPESFHVAMSGQRTTLNPRLPVELSGVLALRAATR